jgi:hypothetical protein
MAGALSARAGDADPGSLKEEKKSFALLWTKIAQAPLENLFDILRQPYAIPTPRAGKRPSAML